MRLFHLVGLRGANGERLRVRFDGPLVLPRWISEPDREVILAFVQDILADHQLPRVEVDCDTFLVPSDRELLRHLRLRGDDVLLVVRVRGAGVRLVDILRDPEISSFSRVAIVSDQDIEGATVGALGQLCVLVRETVEDAYDRLSEEMELPDCAADLLRPLLTTLLNPILVCEAYNALIRAHAEELPSDQQLEAVEATVLGRLLDGVDAEEAVALATRAIPRRDEYRLESVAEAPDAYERLRARLLVRDGELQRWARYLPRPLGRRLLRARILRLGERPALDDKRVAQILARFGRRESSDDPTVQLVAVPLRWIAEGQHARAAAEVSRLRRIVPQDGSADLARSDLELAEGRIADSEGRVADALTAFDRALTLVRDTDHLADRAVLEVDRAICLLRLGSVDAALLAFDEACIANDRVAVLEDRVHARLRFASWLPKSKWVDAERTLRAALQLARGGVALAATLEALAVGLRDAGDTRESLGFFRELLALPLPPAHRARALYHFACAVGSDGGWLEAESALREAALLEAAVGAAPVTRAMSLTALGIGLAANHRWQEAEATFLSALALTRGSSDEIVATTLHEYASGLVAQGRLEEADACLRASAASKDSEMTPRSTVMHRLATAYQNARRWEEAERCLRELIGLVNGRPIVTSAIFLQLEIVLRAQGRVEEAQRARRTAVELTRAPSA